MNPYQKQIKKFCEERNWGQFHNPKDLLLGIVEEIGELRNIRTCPSGRTLFLTSFEIINGRTESGNN